MRQLVNKKGRVKSKKLKLSEKGVSLLVPMWPKAVFDYMLMLCVGCKKVSFESMKGLLAIEDFFNLKSVRGRKTEVECIQLQLTISLDT